MKFFLRILSVVILFFPGSRATVTFDDWRDLNATVGGRLLKGIPFSSPCFSIRDGHPMTPNPTACDAVRNGYDDELLRSNISGAYMITQWETCQSSAQQCLLDYLDPENSSPSLPPQTCSSGSIPGYFIDVRSASDVVAALNFSRKTSVPLVIKNTGHDYKGRSSAPGSLALWTHNLKNISYNASFIPEGCSKPNPALTVGAGVQWQQAYQFADAHNFTIVGGTDRTVGVSGGWVQGGGHSALSNTMGMGVDRVLEFKIITPDGELHVANACQNTDLFWALRGGGGGTFGVVVESTTLVSPVVTVQARAPEMQGSWRMMGDDGGNDGGIRCTEFRSPKSDVIRCSHFRVAISFKQNMFTYFANPYEQNFKNRFPRRDFCAHISLYHWRYFASRFPLG
ncbi:hypothetical protein B0H19DRAFT_1143029 [Mycena capillaripes]|nr:hypothetical protein B0H19DRAFT_1143029 [Mycena capillaripes]